MKGELKMKKIAMAIGVWCLVLGAGSAFAVPTWALLKTGGAEGEAIDALSYYQAYYCSLADAAAFLDGKTTAGDITAYLAENRAAYDGLAGVGVKFDPYAFDDGVYGFTDYFATGKTAGDVYLAIASYTGGENEMFRVFTTEANAAGSILFDPSKTGGSAGDWTPAPAPIPEPTGGLLLLLGVAGLALRRK